MESTAPLIYFLQRQMFSTKYLEKNGSIQIDSL